MRIFRGWDVFSQFIDLMYSSKDEIIVRKLVRFFIDVSNFEGKGIHVNQEICYKQMIEHTLKKEQFNRVFL